MKSLLNKSALAGVALGALMALPGTGAQADALSEIRALKARLSQLEAQVAKQNKEAKETKAEAHHATNVANAAAAHGKVDPNHKPPPPVFVSFKNGLYVETEDKDFTFQIGGRVHVDGGAQSNPDGGSASNAFIRRARLEVAAKVFKRWYYRLQIELPRGNTAAVRDAWMGFKYPLLASLGFKKDIFIQVGNHLEPFGLETLSTSNSGITFIERSLMGDAFHPFRHIGLSLSTGDHNWGVKGGVYTTSPQDEGNNPLANQHQYWEFAGRGVVLPVRTENELVHLGGSFRYYEPNGATAATDGRRLHPGAATNEANVLGTRLARMPALDCGPQSLAATGLGLAFAGIVHERNCVKNAWHFNAEFLAVYGPASLQAEYTHNIYERDPNIIAQNLLFNAGVPATAGVINASLIGGYPLGRTIHSSGWYAQAAVFLTGETRITGYTDIDHNVNTPNSFSTAPKILNPVSKGGFGALEVAARYSTINLNNGATNFNYLGALVGAAAGTPALALANLGVAGGRQANMTLGLNWYPEKGYRFLVNYVRVLNNTAPFNEPFKSNSHNSAFITRAEVWW
jgi:phosphate-selective porin OprO/OprP